MVPMFESLGRIISRSWPVWLIAWVVLRLATWAFAPRWREVARDGEFNGRLGADLGTRRESAAMARR